MDAFVLALEETEVDTLHDPFFDVDFDPGVQTGSDWYRLMLAASFGGKVVHGATTTATCETLTKVDEDFAKDHACARINLDLTTKQVKQPSDYWPETNLAGRNYYGTATENKARMLFDTVEWEPATRVRASNAAFVGGLLCAQGASLLDATTIASAVAGEPVPESAITNTELPLSVLRREAAAMAKHNHTVYGYGNTQRAIKWDAHQFHDQTLPADAALDWSRITTIARYIGEANCTLDTRFFEYARTFGVPYSLVKLSWATVHATDYIFDPQLFTNISTDVGKLLPTPPLLHEYDKQAANLYDAIHRMANEVKIGLSDLTIDNLLRIAETYRKRQHPISQRRTQGTELLAETKLHRYSAESAAGNVATSARSWDALVCAVTELVSSHRAMRAACASAVTKYKAHQDYHQDLELLMLELCDTAVWLRAFDYLKAALSNHFKARERISKLKRTLLGNSAPLETPTILTQRTRLSLGENPIRLANLAMAGRMPMNRMSVDARRVVAHQNIDRHAALYVSVNAHLGTSKREWAERYHRLAATYKLAGGPVNLTKCIHYGVASKAFGMVNAYLMSRPADGFLDPNELSTSYLVAAANNYIRKRHINKPDFQPLVGKTAEEQARLLDDLLHPTVPFSSAYEFCNKRLSEFYADIALGVKPELHPDDTSPPESKAVPVAHQLSDTEVAALIALLETPQPSKPSYAAVLQSYQSENMADRHALANGYTDFLEAYNALNDKARYDPETEYTVNGLRAELRTQQAEDASYDAPVV